MAIPPIILIADDGVRWYRSLTALAEAIESPDVNAGIYMAFDASGLKLDIRCPNEHRSESFFRSVPVHPITIHDGATRDIDTVKSAIIEHLTRAGKAEVPVDASLAFAVSQLTLLQPADA
jgi:hypothetical protein